MTTLAVNYPGLLELRKFAEENLVSFDEPIETILNKKEHTIFSYAGHKLTFFIKSSSCKTRHLYISNIAGNDYPSLAVLGALTTFFGFESEPRCIISTNPSQINIIAND